ncbi:MAG TPA: response regulator [Chitinivibrionales bacterium]
MQETKKIILAVDDAPEILKVLSSTLSAEGYVVITADGGERALEIVTQLRPALILLDIRMTGMDGVEVCRRLKASAATADIPVILMSAYAEADDWAAGLNVGAADYITKPFHHVELLLRVKTHLTLTAMRASLNDAQQTAEKKIRESERRYRSLFNAMNEGFCLHEVVFDQGGTPVDYRIVDANPAFEKIMGISMADAIGKLSTTLYGVSTPPFLDKYVNVAVSGVPCQFETDFEPLQKSLRIAVFSPEKGVFATIFEDSTEQRKMEQVLQNTQKLEALGILAGGIAHDFNNLLGGIYGYIDLAQETTAASKSKEFLLKATATIERGRDLTRQLITFAKGGTPVQSVAHLFPFVQETTQFALSGSSVSCGFDIASGLWPCNFDKNQIGQVFDNIVINAKQSMPGGGVIEIAAHNATILEKQHPILAAGKYVHLAVKDCGIGIPKEILSRIFDPFFTTKSSGHGLGLATSYSIIKRHGGTIDVESQPGAGSMFHIYIPAIVKEISASERTPDSVFKGSGTFLVMDDESVMLEVTRGMLESFGYTVVCFETGKDAVSFINTETKTGRAMAGAIFDLTVPGGMGGKDAVCAVRGVAPTLPIFASSGHAEDPIIADPKAFGFTGSICKPFRKSDLAALLNEYIA